MNLQNLSLGQVVPNYRALCRLLNEPIKGGKSKECQLDEWARHFAFDRLPNSNAYIITEIYDHVMPEWASDKTLYTHLIELLLMHELAKLPKGQNTCSYTKTNLFQALGMVNSYYLRCNHYLIAQDIKHIPKWQVSKFYQNSNRILSNILFRALNSMKDRSLIKYSQEHIIIEDGDERVADDDEVEIILMVGRKTLADMGYKKISHIPYHKLQEYYTRVNEALEDEHGWERVYQEIQIVFTNKYILHDVETVINELLEIAQKHSLKLRPELNTKVIGRLHNSIDLEYQQNCDEYKVAHGKRYNHETIWGEPPPIDYAHRKKLEGVFNLPNTYVDNQKYLVSRTVRLEEKS